MANLLSNPEFVGAHGSTLLAAPAAVFASGPAAATGWMVGSSTPGTTTTDVVIATRPGSPAQMMHVCTTGTNDNGVFQEFQSPGDDVSVLTSVWVFVVRGKVGVGTGFAASTKPDDAHSTTTGAWELLQATNKEGPATTFALYSVRDPDVSDELQQGACFYFESPSVEPQA